MCAHVRYAIVCAEDARAHARQADPWHDGVARVHLAACGGRVPRGHVRQPRHRHPHDGQQLHPARHESPPALRERHPRPRTLLLSFTIHALYTRTCIDIIRPGERDQ